MDPDMQPLIDYLEGTSIADALTDLHPVLARPLESLMQGEPRMNAEMPMSVLWNYIVQVGDHPSAMRLIGQIQGAVLQHLWEKEMSEALRFPDVGNPS